VVSFKVWPILSQRGEILRKALERKILGSVSSEDIYIDLLGCNAVWNSRNILSLSSGMMSHNPVEQSRRWTGNMVDVRIFGYGREGKIPVAKCGKQLSVCDYVYLKISQVAVLSLLYSYVEVTSVHHIIALAYVCR
jgi:hypothetical protein